MSLNPKRRQSSMLRRRFCLSIRNLDISIATRLNQSGWPSCDSTHDFSGIDPLTTSAAERLY